MHKGVCCWEYIISLTSFELQGKYISCVLWINSIKKGLFNGSLFPKDKCGLNTEASNVLVVGWVGGGFWCLVWPRDYTCLQSDASWPVWLLAGCQLLFADLHARETVWPEAKYTSACLWCSAMVNSHIESGVSFAKQSLHILKPITLGWTIIS